MKIKITKNGPYIVTGNVPLGELIIVEGKNGNEYREGRTFPLKEEYALCRCGKSKNMPFCDGSHITSKFDGTLTASKDSFKEQAVRYEGENVVLEDNESLCAFARFCHSDKGNIWDLTETDEDEAIRLACNCPSGRLVIYDKVSKKEIEPFLEPSIMLLQDPNKKCSGPLFVRGEIDIYDEDDNLYESRNRVTLCRCGESKNKPFCDASHVSAKFNDNLKSNN